MAAVAQAFSQWIGSWMARDYPAFWEWSRVVSAQSWAMVRGTMMRGPDGQSDPWLQVYADHPAVGNIMGWPRGVLPVFQQPLCNLPVLAVVVVLDVGTLWRYERQLRRVIPAVTERRSMAVLVGSKQLAQVQGDDAQGHVTEAMFSLPEGDDNVAADARHTLDTLGYCILAMGYCILAAGYTESGVVGNCGCAAGNGLRGVTGEGRLHGGGGTRTTRGPLLLRRMRAALYLGCCFAPIGDALAFCLLLCCCDAVPCPFDPGEQTGQRPLPLLMLTLCSCQFPQSLVGRYPRSSGSSVMLWATSGSPGTHGIERGRNHLSVRDAR